LPLTQVDDYAENVLTQRNNINRRAGTTYYLKHRAEPAIGYCAGGGMFGASKAGIVIFTERAHRRLGGYAGIASSSAVVS
jgi:hypothetical protein